ncbi:polysaccharide lyase family 14 protein, partial [Linnemannia elongata AG-77]
GEHVLRSLYPAGSYSHSGDKHASFVSTPLPPAAFTGSKSRYIRLEYQMMFEPGFKWVKGGKLPGILMGSELGCNAGCSGGGTAENCFSTRMMWRADGMGELYLYAAKSLAANGGGCLNGMGVKVSPGARNECNPTYGISIGRGGKFQFKSGQWHNITQVVRVNSKGKAVRDGYLAVYLDGAPVVQADKLVLLKNGYDPAKGGEDRLVKFMFSSFFGGSTKDYATPSKQWIAWKDFKM